MLAVINESKDPYFNQAFEEYVFNTIKNEEILILWRNSPAVIVGCYQNICKEVNVYALKKAGIPVIRRMSGGGTVYHDLGNVNYTLIRDKEGFVDYDDFLSPVIKALNDLGIAAHKDRNSDIAIGGKKISGSAQKVSGGRVLHHGTLLFDSDLSVLDEITTKNKNESFVSKASESAICKVTNIKEALDFGIGIEEFMSKLLVKLAGDSYKEIKLDIPELAEIEKLAGEKYRSTEWTWGKTPAFVFEKRGMFKGKEIKISYSAKKGYIDGFELASDFIDASRAQNLFLGKEFSLDLFEENAQILAEDEKENLLKIMM
jgi:lipoyltransferase and lipoate-protein ligase